jgi:hypothetical protein
MDFFLIIDKVVGKGLVDTGGKLCGSKGLHLKDKELKISVSPFNNIICVMADKNQTLGQLSFSNMFIPSECAFEELSSESKCASR